MLRRIKDKMRLEERRKDKMESQLDNVRRILGKVKEAKILEDEEEGILDFYAGVGLGFLSGGGKSVRKDIRNWEYGASVQHFPSHQEALISSETAQELKIMMGEMHPNEDKEEKIWDFVKRRAIVITKHADSNTFAGGVHYVNCFLTRLCR